MQEMKKIVKKSNHTRNQSSIGPRQQQTTSQYALPSHQPLKGASRNHSHLSFKKSQEENSLTTQKKEIILLGMMSKPLMKDQATTLIPREPHTQHQQHQRIKSVAIL